jgi:phosphohistidine phosphatase
MLEVADWPNNRHPIVLIGHQPAIGHLISTLLFGAERNLAIRKGAVCWLSNRRRAEEAELAETGTVVLRALISPDLA